MLSELNIQSWDFYNDLYIYPESSLGRCKAHFKSHVWHSCTYWGNFQSHSFTASSATNDNPDFVIRQVFEDAHLLEMFIFNCEMFIYFWNLLLVPGERENTVNFLSREGLCVKKSRNLKKKNSTICIPYK